LYECQGLDVSNYLHPPLTSEEMKVRIDGLGAEYDRNIEYGFLSDQNETREHYSNRQLNILIVAIPIHHILKLD